MAEGSPPPEIPSSNVDEGELLREDEKNIPTNPHPNLAIYNILILFYNNNNNNNDVARWVRKTLANPEGEKVLCYIHEKKVYTVTVLRRLQGVETSTAYGIHKELEERLIIKKTGFYADHPSASRAGRPSEFYALVDIDISSSSHPLIVEAQERYTESEHKYDKSLQDDYSDNKVKNTIITETSEYYRKRGQIGSFRPPKREIIIYLRANYPDLEGPQIAEYSGKLELSLYKEASD